MSTNHAKLTMPLPVLALALIGCPVVDNPGYTLPRAHLTGPLARVGDEAVLEVSLDLRGRWDGTPDYERFTTPDARLYTYVFGGLTPGAAVGGPYQGIPGAADDPSRYPVASAL